MKFSFQQVAIVLFFSLVGFYSCKKLDDEPVRTDITAISRLYVSFANYQDGGESTIKNLMIIDPADTVDLSSSFQYLSPAKGGGPILFNPLARAMFQASANDNILQDTFIRVIPFQNELYGTPGISGNLGYTGFRGVKGLAYYNYSQATGTGTPSSNTAFMLAATNNGNNSSLYAVSSPSGKAGSKGGAKIIDKQINLGGILPSSMTLLEGNGGNEKHLLIAFNSDGTGNGSGFALYTTLKQELIDRPRDTIVNATQFAPALKVYVRGKSNFGSLCYAPNRKLLAITAYSGSGQNAVGEVLFFRDPDNIFKAGAQASNTISADYVVGGTETGLVQPQSVAIDDRIKAGKYFYVSDQYTKKISRFEISAEGNVKPNLAPTYNLTPNYIYLDAR